MSDFVFMAVLFAALMHAAYSALIKGRRADVSSWDNVFAITFVPVPIGLVALFFLPAPHPDSWLYFFITGLSQVTFMAAIAQVYRLGDYATGYPLIRGMAPIMGAVTATFFLGDAFPFSAQICLGLISGGILLMAFGERHTAREFIAQALMAFFCAVMIAVYVVIDAKGARLSGSPIAYGLWVFILQGLSILLWRVYKRDVPWQTLQYRSNWIAGLLSLGAYCIIMWAVTKTSAAMVATLRETAILFSVLIAAFFLREPLKPTRLVGVGLIAAGVILSRLF